MADIDIVPKHRSYAWVWIVVAIVVALALWYAFAGGRGTRVGSILPGPNDLAMVSVGAPSAG